MSGDSCHKLHLSNVTFPAPLYRTERATPGLRGWRVSMAYDRGSSLLSIKKLELAKFLCFSSAAPR
jgi:hypothetical protein